MKKVTSLFLSLIIIVTCIAGLDFSVQAEELPTYKNYQASTYATDDVYRIFNLDTYNHTFAQMLRGNSDFQLNISKSEAEFDNVQFYELMLFDVINQASKTEELLDYLNNRYTNYLISATTNIVDLDLSATLDENMTNAINEALNNSADFSVASNNASKILNYSQTGLEYIMNIARYQTAYDLNEYEAEIIQMISDSTDNTYLKTACSNLATYQKNLLDEIFQEVLQSNSTVETIYNITVNALWDKISESDSAYQGTNDIASAYYSIIALDNFESALKNCMSTAKDNYSQTEENAGIFIASISLYESSAILGCNYTEEMLDAQYKNLSSSVVFSSENEINDLYNYVENYENALINTFASIEESCNSKFLTTYYPEYNDLLSKYNESIEIIPIEELTCEKKKLTIAVNEYYFVTTTFNPENTTETQLKYISSNEDVVSVGDFGNLTGLSEGTSIITIYSTVDNSICDTMTVTVSGYYDTVTGSTTSTDKKGNETVTTDAHYTDYTYSVYNGEATIKKYKGSAKKTLHIPSKLGGYPVTEIGNSVFKNCDFQEIILPNSLESIGSYAFQNCNLTKIDLPNSLTSIGSYAFQNCNFQEIILPNNLKSIGSYAFQNCKKLKNVYLPESLTTMYASIFSGCENLKEITIPKFVTKMDKPLSGSSIDTVIFEDGRESIPQNACQNATSLKEVVIPSEVTSIGAYAFSGCTSLTNDGINIPNGVTAINSNTFENCTSLTGKGVDIPNGVTTIGSYAFSGCTGITEFSLPDTVTEIGYASYKSCNFSNITILNSVKTINEYAFSDCNELTDVTLPENLVTIKNGIFSGCTKLTEITIPKLVTTMNESLSGSSIDTVIFEDGRESIPENACKGGSNIKKVVIPSSVRIINAYAFSNCNELTDITLPANLVTIRDSIFSGCTKLTEITIPKLVTTMNESLSGSSIDTVIFEDGRESIPEKACKDGNNIKKVVIPSSVKYIFSYAFSGCTSLTNSGLDIPNGVTTIGSYAFSDCTGIAEFSLPNTVETIDEYAFNGCKFKEVILPKNLTTIGSYAFQNCSELTYVSLPEHLIVMHACVFNNCTKLKEITIPPNVTRMDYPVDGAYVSAFSGSSITKIILESGRTYIPAYSFKDAKVLDTLVVPKEVTAVGKQAFFNSGIKKFYGYADSYAQTYANNNFIEFVELDCAHDNTIIKYAYPASDDEEGYTGNIYCADCGLLLTEGENIPTTGHSFEIVDKKEPTCTKVGSIEYVCSDCGISYTDFVPATNHTFSITRIDSTCSQTGYTIYTCDKCGYSYESDYTPILEHKYIENIIEYPTCTQTGMAEYTCSLCGDNYTEILSMKEHEYQVQVFEPTPNEKGYTEHTCNNCGYSYIDNIIPYASDYSVFDKLLSDLHDIYFPEDYSESSYEHLMELYDIYAELIYGSNEGASQIEIDNAISELLTGISNLEPYLTLNVSSQNGTYTASYTEQPDIYKYYKLLYGTAVTLKATPDEGYKFVGWYDTINNRYFSNNEEYTFKITNNTRLKAIFVKEGSSSLIFTTYSNWIKTTVTKTIDEWNDIISIDDLLPEVPYRYGYSNGHWVYDNEDVLAKLQSGENVYLIPEYDTNDTTLPTPPSPNDDTPVLDLYYKLDAESDIGSFLMAVGIPEDCKVETIAIAFYYDKVENAFYPQEFYLYINNKMLVSRFSTDEIDDIYIANMNNFTDKYNWAVRGYISYYDADGNLKTVYSNQINIINREQV